jgi:predicted RNase H-like nuclease (RuvC/YqgF family)
MPLINSASKEAREENIKTEIDAGKPIKQAIAIGYSNQRESENRPQNEREKERHEHERRKYGK